MNHSLRLILFPLLAAVILLGAMAVPGQAQEELTPQEKKALQQKDTQSGAEEVGVGDYSRWGSIWGTTLQLSILLATFLLIAIAGWKLPRLSSHVLALFRTPKENRTWKRVQVPSEYVEAEITDQSDGSVRGRAILRDIAPGGACLEFIDLPEAYQPGKDLQLRIRVRNSTELILSNLLGSVRWTQKNKAGIQFSSMLHYSQDILESLFTPVGPGRKDGTAT